MAEDVPSVCGRATKPRPGNRHRAFPVAIFVALLTSAAAAGEFQPGVQALGSADQTAQHKAFLDLLRGRAKALPDLESGLSDPNPAVRKQCAKLIGRLRKKTDDAQVAVAQAAKTDADHDVRIAALDALARFTGKGLPTLIQVAATDKDCDKKSCSTSANPPIVADDGSVHLEAHEFKDEARLRAVAEEERLVREAQRWVGRDNDAIDFMQRFPVVKPRDGHGTIGEVLAGLFEGTNQTLNQVNQMMPSIVTPMAPWSGRWSASEISGPLYRVTLLGSSVDVYNREIHQEYSYEVDLKKRTVKPTTLGSWMIIGGDAVMYRLREKGELPETLDSDVSSLSPAYSLRGILARSR